jgi:hypothetical protein
MTHGALGAAGALRLRPPAGVGPRRRHSRPAAAPGVAFGVLLGAALISPLAGAPPPLAAQQVQVAVLPDSVFVGDVVRVGVRLVLEPGESVLLPDTLPLGEWDAENAARLRERREALPDGRMRVTGTYFVTPWRPGGMDLPDLPLRIATADGSGRTVLARLPDVEVASVLPATAADLEPRPARGVLGPNWPRWLLALLALVVLAVAAAVVAWLRRRRRVAVQFPVPASARERALAALDGARAAGLVERGQWKEFYSQTSHAVREYLQAIEPAWSDDLTTSEILARVGVMAGPAMATALAGFLVPADQVKFARRVPSPDRALAEWEAARRLVETVDGPRPVQALAEVAA